jgi:hypothetical protein
MQAALLGGGANYDIANVPGLLMAYDASRTNTMFQDVTKLVPVTPGSVVKDWVDFKSGRDAIQASTSNAPKYFPFALNGGPCVQGDGSDDYLATIAFTSLPQPFTVVLCGQWVATTNGMTPFDGQGAALVVSGRTYTATLNWAMNDGTAVSTGVPINTATAHVVAATHNGATSVFRLDGLNAVTPPNPGTNAMTTVRLFERFDGSNATTFKMGLALVIAGTITDATFGLIRGYCRSRWGNP